MMMKFFKIALGVFIAIFIASAVAFYYVIEHVAPYSPIKPSRVKHTASLDTSKAEEFNIIVEDSITLKGLFIHALTDKPYGTVIILHGIASSRESQLDMAENLSVQGFNSIVFDLRAQGESGGTYCTFGYYEKFDVSRYIDESLKRYKNSAPFAVMGHSLGGAIAIQAMAKDKRIKCGVVSSTFTSLKEITFDYMKRLTGIPFRFVSDISLKNSEKIARFPVDVVSPEEYAKKVCQPVLLIHGTNDERISINYGKRIFKNLKSPDKQWYPVKGANHNNLWEIGGKEYQRRIAGFLKTYLKD
ncbi:MAG: alpha/beta hydrolase [Bacillota bacterium]